MLDCATYYIRRFHVKVALSNDGCKQQMVDRRRSVHFENGRFFRVASYLLVVTVGAARNTVNK